MIALSAPGLKTSNRVRPRQGAGRVAARTKLDVGFEMHISQAASGAAGSRVRRKVIALKTGAQSACGRPTRCRGSDDERLAGSLRRLGMTESSR